jgi:putative hydrolase of the HAD superfamily
LKPQALVFDLGGVLIDVDLERAFAAWGAAAGVPSAEIATRFSLDEACCAHERGEIDDAAYFAHLRRLLRIEISDEAMSAGWNAIIGEPMPGIEALVQRLARDVPLYVFSNTNPAHIAHFTPRLTGLFAQFRRVFTSCEIGRRKPEPEAFARLAAAIGLPASRLAFFDDAEQNVAGARRAGLHAFHVRSPAEIEAISADLLRERTAR